MVDGWVDGCRGEREWWGGVAKVLVELFARDNCANAECINTRVHTHTHAHTQLKCTHTHGRAGKDV